MNEQNIQDNMLDFSISLIKRVKKNKKITKIANSIIVISLIFSIPLLWNIIPIEYEIDYNGFTYISEHKWRFISILFFLFIGGILNSLNGKNEYGRLLFQSEKIVEKWNSKKTNVKLENIRTIKYLYTNAPIESNVEEKHWITIQSIGTSEIYSEFLGNKIQNKLINIFAYYKTKGINVQVDTIY